LIFVVGWWVLVIITFFIGAWSTRLYLQDKDKRKLMFSIIFFLSIFIFIFNAIQVSSLFQNNLIINNLFQWLTLPVMTAILISVIESFSSSKDFEKGFLYFCIFSILSVGLIFLPFPIEGFLKYVRICIAIGVIVFSLYQLVKWKNMQSLYFLAAVASFTVAGVAHAYSQYTLSIFAYAVAYLLLGLIFIWYSSNKSLTPTGMGSYFSLQKKLNDTKTELDQSRELYKSIVENTQDVIILTDENGVNSYVSPSSTRVLGYNPSELTNTNPWPIKVYYKDQQKVQDAMKKGYAGYPGSNLEYRIYKKDSSLCWISHSWTPIIENGKLQTIVSSGPDS